MSAAEGLELLPYEGRLLTAPEIALCELVSARRKALRDKLEDERHTEQLLMNSSKIVKERVESLRAAYEAAEAAEAAPAVEALQLPRKALVESKPAKARPPQADRSGERDKFDEDTDTELPHPNSRSLAVPGGPIGSEAAQQIPARQIKKKQRVEEDSDEEAWDGRPKVFSAQGLVFSGAWDSAVAEANLGVALPNYDYVKTNTLAISYTVDLNSSGWAFNLCPGSDAFLSDVLLHFNPRYVKQQVMLNDRQGTWGSDVKKRLAVTDAIYTQKVQLVVQLRPEGFLLFANDKFVTFMAHRRPIHQFRDLKLTFITEDDNGNRLAVQVDRVWWGHLDLDREILSPSVRAFMEKSVAEPVPSVLNPLPPRTIVVSNLPKVNDLVELQGLEYALHDLFEEFTPEAIAMVRGQGLAYCRLPASAMVDEAIAALDNAEIGTPEEAIVLRLTRMPAFSEPAVAPSESA